MSGQEQQAADRRCRSDPASHSAEQPLVQSRGGEFGPTCQTRSTLPGRTASGAFTLGATQVFNGGGHNLCLPPQPRSRRATCSEGSGSAERPAAAPQQPGREFGSETTPGFSFLKKEVSPLRQEMDQLTGFSDEEGPGLDSASKPSPCLLTSRVVKRLDSIPRMCRMDCLFVGLG